MKNKDKKIDLTWLGIVAIVISIVALCLTLFRIEPITYDWMGVLVGILSLLVMLLIGWQIYSMFDIKGKIEEIRHDVDSAMMKVNIECGTLSVSVYSTLFNEFREKKEDAYGYFRYGLLVILHSHSIGNIALCHNMIQVLIESFPVTKVIRNTEKAFLLQTAAKISETSLHIAFKELHNKLIVELKSAD